MLTWPGACPKCFGDLQRREQPYGAVRACIDCGHIDVAPMLRIPRRTAARGWRPRLVRVPAAFRARNRAA